MKLSLRINGADRTMDLAQSGETCRFRMESQEERQAEVEEAEPGVYSILIGGRSFEARVERNSDRALVVIDGRRFEIEVRDPRRMKRRAGAAGGEGRQQVAAPMPGKVVRILVETGQTVEAGQGILVVEAMKMQNEMKAPRAGQVVSIAAREGATVNAGEVLAVIE
jgi:biotin carboxyl carrier protein